MSDRLKLLIGSSGRKRALDGAVCNNVRLITFSSNLVLNVCSNVWLTVVELFLVSL